MTIHSHGKNETKKKNPIFFSCGVKHSNAREWTKQKYRWDEQKAGSHFECEPSTHIFVVRHAVQCVPITNSKYYSTHGLCVFLSVVSYSAQQQALFVLVSLPLSLIRYRYRSLLLVSCTFAACSCVALVHIYFHTKLYEYKYTRKYTQPSAVECWVKHVSEYDDGVALKACV